ncbi:MAG TPA: metallophosphoesterase [Firmicutes bacterium]|nr:metallophosphoesterase [Bacillota bacterium]
MKRNHWTAALLSAAAAAGAAYFVAENRRVESPEIPVPLPGLPGGMEGLRIAHLSDLHFPHCARPPRELAALVRRLHPDLIVLTGDLIDRADTFSPAVLAETGRRLAAIAPCYAVPGNHEFRAGLVKEWTALLTGAGVRVLGEEWVRLTRRGGSLWLGGLPYGRPIPPPGEGNRLVLSHYPENFPAYAAKGYDLVLTGHAHGGQFRFGGRGLYSPGEGLFPRYTSGLYALGGSRMVVSRGLRSGWMPPRLGNPPHLPVVVLTGQRG